MKIGILGGGLTGLTLGNELGHDFEILEKESECGGLCRSLYENGFWFDWGGSHIIFSKDIEILNYILLIIGKNNLQKKIRNTKILYKNNYIKYPFENGLNGLSKEDNFECLYYFFQNIINKEKGVLKKPTTLKEWFYYTFGKGITDQYLVPYNEKIWKYPLEKMNLEWVERVPNPPIEDIIKSSLGIETEGYTHQLYFYYPKLGGIQALIQALENKIKSNIITNFEVKSLQKVQNKWIVSSDINKKEFDIIISTIPIFELIKSLDDVPAKVLNAVKNLKYTSLITVMIGLDKSKINDFSWVYIPDKNINTHRISFPMNFSNLTVPKDKSSILAEITCYENDEIWQMSDENIINKIIYDLNKMGILKEDNVIYTNIRRSKYAYVISDLEYAKNIGIVRDYFEDCGIILCGRFSEFKYMNMDACIRSAIEISKHIQKNR